MKKVPLKQLIVISDTHCGDQMGLCPEEVVFSHGGKYVASHFQRAVLECWNSFWDDWVPTVTRGEPWGLVFVGDMIEGTHHGATHPITGNKADQQEVALRLLQPLVDAAEVTFYISGSRAHAGESGEDEEMLGRALGTKKDEIGNNTSYERFIKLGGSKGPLIHFTHHIGVSGSMAYEATALTKEYQEFNAEAARWGRPIADILVRAHRHRHIEVSVPTAAGYGKIFVCPAWQLKTPWLFSTPGGRTTTPVIGGSLIRVGDEEFYTRHKTWETARKLTEHPTIEEI